MKKFVLFLVMIIFVNICFGGLSGAEIICDFKYSSCSSNEVLFFNVYDFNNGGGDVVINSNVLLNIDANYSYFSIPNKYDRYFCCRTNLGADNLRVKLINSTEDCGFDSGQKLLWFSNTINARTSIVPETHYNKTLCVGVNNENLDLDLKKGGDLSDAGYKCLFRISDTENVGYNGLISECNATFGPTSDRYKTVIWGKLIRNANDLKCSNDCTNKLDGRIYLSCGKVFIECKDVPSNCDGILKGTWVSYNFTHEIKCEFPWNTFRPKVFTGSSLNVEVKKDCDNLIIREKNVIYQNQNVKMKIYICK